VISPESCSSILWHSWDYKEQAAEALKLDAESMHKSGIVDGILQEPEGGAHRNPDAMAATLKASILQELEGLQKLDSKTLIMNRIQKYEAMGRFDYV
jgi:acetyl-CoA carboxylase carboxyl transferase subunit alpha